MPPIKLIRSPLDTRPDFPVPFTFERSILFSSTIFLTAGDKLFLVLGGTYFSSTGSLSFSSANVSKTKVLSVPSFLAFSFNFKTSLFSSIFLLFGFHFGLSNLDCLY